MITQGVVCQVSKDEDTRCYLSDQQGDNTRCYLSGQQSFMSLFSMLTGARFNFF